MRCVCSFSRYLLEVKIDVVLAKIAVTHRVLWEPRYGHGMLVERVNRYLNKGLKIMTNERDSVRVAMEAILLLFMHGIAHPSPARTSPAAWLPSTKNFNFLSTFQLISTWNSLLLLPQSPPIRVTSLLVSAHSGKSLPSLTMNSGLIIGNSSTHDNPTLRFIASATPFLLVAQPDLTLGVGRLINLSIA